MSIETFSQEHATATADVAYQLDPSRSSVEFAVRHFWGLMTVKGRFERFEGKFDLRVEPAVELTIDAASLTTKNKRRDQHLRSADFFDVEHHPEVRFVSDTAVAADGTLKLAGRLVAAGKELPLELQATIHSEDDELEINAETEADYRLLGMTWSPAGMLRAPVKLVVKGRLIPVSVPESTTGRSPEGRR